MSGRTVEFVDEYLDSVRVKGLQKEGAFSFCLITGDFRFIRSTIKQVEIRLIAETSREAPEETLRIKRSAFS